MTSSQMWTDPCASQTYTRKLVYDLWGDTVNTASRMESHGEVGRIQVSEATHALLEGKFEFVFRGEVEVEVKGKGRLPLWFLEGRVGSNP